MTATIARRLTISGSVQGVGFRAFLHAHAERLGVSGFVRNRKDGTVEAVIAGREEALTALTALCREGPPAARVTEVKVSEAQESVDKGFKHLPTV